MSVLLLAAILASTASATSDCHATAFIGTAYRDRAGPDVSVKTEIAAYADGYASPATGVLVRAGDGYGDMGCSLPWKRPAGTPWIALVRRGGCSIDTKIANAVDQGANGVIIYNNRDSLSLQNLRINTRFQNLISVVFTYKWKGEELTTLLDFGIKVVAEISIANPCVAINTNYERNMQLVSIFFLCFIVLTISLAWLIFYYVQRHRDLQAKERKARGYSEADEKALKSIPTKTLKSNDKLVKDESECCAICIDPYKSSEVVRTLVCSHEFHKDCIDPWLLENRTCPMCKKDILNHYGSRFLGSQESIVQVVAEEARLAGPSAPNQVVIVANRVTSPMPSPMRSPPTSDVEIVTERVQPTNRDAACFAGSRSSLLTVDSAHEALQLIDSVQEISETACMKALPPKDCHFGSDACPSTSKSVCRQLKSLAREACPATFKTHQSSKEPRISKTTEKVSEKPPCSPKIQKSADSLLDSCQELCEGDDSTAGTPMCVDETTSTAEDDVLLEIVSSNEAKESENS